MYEIPGDALFAVFLKGAGFSSIRNTPHSKKGWIEISQRERENAGSENLHA
jgi:hypothetical protein